MLAETRSILVSILENVIFKTKLIGISASQLSVRKDLHPRYTGHTAIHAKCLSENVQKTLLEINFVGDCSVFQNLSFTCRQLHRGMGGGSARGGFVQCTI